MPTATLTFNLPDEYLEFTDAKNGSVFRNVLKELDEYLRQQVKHNDKLKSKEKQCYESMRAKMYESLTENGLII
jgi:hypothetical protein